MAGPSGQQSNNGGQQGGGQQLAPILEPGVSISKGDGWGMYPGHASPMHHGLDVGVAVGTKCYAPMDGQIVYSSDTGFGDEGGMVHFRFDEDAGSIRKGDVIGWGHAVNCHATGKVGRGEQVGVTNYASSPHTHFVYLPGGGGGSIDGTADPEPVFDFLVKGEAPTGPSDPASGGAGGDFSDEDIFAAARAAAYSTSLELPGIMNFAESRFMKGAKSIYNDEPIMDFIKQLCQASMRHFQSLPNGVFFAFYPDPFGSYGHRQPYWKIANVEIVDGGVDLTDEGFATHVFTVGDTQQWDDTATLPEKIASKGVITIFDAFATNFNFDKVIEPPDPNKKDKKQDEKQQQLEGYSQATDFLRRYGVRPHYEEATFIRNPYFEIFYAYTQFQTLWANQFRTQFSFTFMPELYPGGIVELENHELQCYVESVTHSFDYSGGFTTTANLTAPNATKEASSRRLWAGMAGPFLKDKPAQGTSD